MATAGTEPSGRPSVHTDMVSRLVRLFLESNLSIILIVFSLLVGIAVLYVTPREEDPQIVVPLADIYVQFPGHSAAEVEQLVASPLERMLYQIDGVEYVYSMSRADQAVVTVRFYVGQDRERSLVKLFKKLTENSDHLPTGVAGWVMKPVEIDDVPIVTLALTGPGDSFLLRRVGEELVERLAAVPFVSRAMVVGGEPRTIRIELDSDRMRGFQLDPAQLAVAIRGANVVVPGGQFERDDAVFTAKFGRPLESAEQIRDLVVGVSQGQPIFLKDVANVRDGPAEIASYVRHGWGPARGFEQRAGSPGTELSAGPHTDALEQAPFSLFSPSSPAVTIAVAKQKGSNAVLAMRQPATAQGPASP